MRLKNKVAVIIGGANGIGRAIAIRLAAEGASVAVNDIDDAAGQALESEIKRTGRQIVLSARRRCFGAGRFGSDE